MTKGKRPRFAWLRFPPPRTLLKKTNPMIQGCAKLRAAPEMIATVTPTAYGQCIFTEERSRKTLRLRECPPVFAWERSAEGPPLSRRVSLLLPCLPILPPTNCWAYRAAPEPRPERLIEAQIQVSAMTSLRPM